MISARHVWAALIVAVIAHVAFIHAVPRVMMGAAFDRLSANGAANAWRLAERVTPASRTIVRPSPDFAYSICAYDLSDGPVRVSTAPWGAYWSLSLYAANSDNYFVIDDREAHSGAAITLVRRGRQRPDGSTQVVESPTTRGIALIRRLAPNVDDYASAARIASEDVCARFN
jgi:uncharacterized membrane protein